MNITTILLLLILLSALFIGGFSLAIALLKVLLLVFIALDIVLGILYLASL